MTPSRSLWPVAVLLLAAAAAAQNDGEAVVASSWRSNSFLLTVSPGPVVKTFAFRPNASRLDGLTAAPANDGGLMVETSTSLRSLRVLKFQSASKITTLATLPASFTRVPTLLVDAGGDILILNATGGTNQGVYRMPGRGGPLTTLAHNNLNASFVSPFAMTEEPASGDILVLDMNRIMHRIDRSGKVTTLRIAFPAYAGMNGNMHVDHGSGLMHVTYDDYFLALDPNTGATTTIYQRSATRQDFFCGIDGDPFRGGYLMSVYCHSHSSLNGPFLMRYNPRSSTLSTVAALIPATSLSDVLTWRSRMLGGLCRPLHGTPYQVRLAIPSESGRAYFAAASLGTFPGIPVGGKRRVALNPDAFFLLSIQAPTLFSNFQGMLSGTGMATLTVNIPRVPQVVGSRIFLAAVTYDHGGIRVITEPLGVTIE